MLVNNNNMFPAVKKQVIPNVIKVFPSSEYLLQFDGCSKGNPGLAGAGAVIFHYNHEILIFSFHCFHHPNKKNKLHLDLDDLRVLLEN